LKEVLICSCAFAGINVLGSFCVELEATDGTKGFATGFGGPPACWLVAEHFKRFLIGAGR